MTNERAIELLKRISDSQFDGEYGDERREALEMAVRALEGDGDAISRQAAIDAIERLEIPEDMCVFEILSHIELEIGTLPSAQPEQRWIPIKWHECTDEDREEYGFSDDIVAVFDCEMPDDDQPILVTTSHGYVNQDVCYIDDGYSLDSGWDWIEDIVAWMPLPEPWEGEQDG